eukprot:scaffold1588_cov222-Amphora_coffeaeformis.AAC.16
MAAGITYFLPTAYGARVIGMGRLGCRQRVCISVLYHEYDYFIALLGCCCPKVVYPVIMEHKT